MVPKISDIEPTCATWPFSFAFVSIAVYHSRSFSRFIGFRCWSPRAKKMYSSPAFGGSTQMCTCLNPSLRTQPRYPASTEW